MALDECPGEWSEWVSARDVSPVRQGSHHRRQPAPVAERAAGLIESALPDQPRDPLAATAGAYSAAKEAALLQIPLEQVAPIRVIGKFSQEACSSMLEIVVFLRRRAQRPLAEAF